MTQPDRFTQAEHTIKRATMTIAEAARVLEISRGTLLKWHECGYIALVTIGPPQAPIRRVPVSEVERLKIAC